MANTYKHIASYTLASTTTSYVFSSIPQTYTDLVLWMSVRNSASNYGGYEVRLNELGSGDSKLYLRNSNGSTTAAGSASNMTDLFHHPINGDTADTFSTNILFIGNYSRSSYGKPMIGINGGRYYLNATTNSQYGINAGFQDTTNAITSIGIGYGDALAVGSRFSLYGIANS